MSIKKYLVYLFRRFTFLIICSHITLYSGISGAQERSLPNIVILVWNGVRFKETIGDDSGQYIPYLKNVLLPAGTLYDNVYDYNYEFHVPAVVAMTTGNRCEKAVDDLSRVLPEYPTIFQYARKKYREPAHKYWEIGSFGAYTAYSESNEYNEDTQPCILRASLFPYPPNVNQLIPAQIKKILDPAEKLYYETIVQKRTNDMWDAIDEVDYRMFKKVLKTYKPRIILFNMNSLDISHSAHWAKYVTTLRRTDEITYQIWKIIQEDPHYRDNTYLIVTPDHERNRFFMAHTEHTHENPSHVWLYLFGPDVHKGKIISRHVRHIDVCPTIGHILHFDATYSKGKLLHEAFTNQQDGSQRQH